MWLYFTMKINNNTFRKLLLLVIVTIVIMTYLLMKRVNVNFAVPGIKGIINTQSSSRKQQQAKAFLQDEVPVTDRTTTLPPMKENITILAWSHPWKLESWGYREGERIGRCKITYNRSKLMEARAVLFHCFIKLERQLPWMHFRSKDQVFIWWCEEAPPVLKFLHNSVHPFNDFFNWTFTYRYDADVVDNYGDIDRTLRAVEKGKAAVDALIEKKKKIAIWMVARCSHTTGGKKRMEYAQNLKKAGILFDGFGECFHNEKQLPKSDSEKTKKTVAKYKFYFAFENAINCTDYITEKFWLNSLQYGAVPIVWGPSKEDVLKVAPLDSFIHVEDFKSHIELAEYLKFLDKNITEYRKYFRWREDETMTEEKMIKLIEEKHPHIKVHRRPSDLCEKVLTTKTSKTIHSLVDTHIKSNQPVCYKER